MISWDGLKLLVVTLLLLGAAISGDGTMRKRIADGWRLVHAPQSARLEAVVKGARGLLERPLLWIPGPHRV